MLKENDFRRIALGMTGAIEGAHMRHPDFRVHGRIFASLHPQRQMAGPVLTAGMVVLTPGQQQQFMRDHAAAFSPESGAWGRAGYTRVQLDAIDEETLGDAMTLAWQNTVDKQKTAKKPQAAPEPTMKKAIKTKAVKTNAAGKSAPARAR